MQWIPELGVKDTDLMEPIQGVHKIARDRWNLQCSVCRQRVGAKIQCNKCYTAFHPLCGRIKGLTMDMKEHAGGPHLPLHTVLLCHKHCAANPGGYGVQYLCATSDSFAAVALFLSPGFCRLHRNLRTEGSTASVQLPHHRKLLCTSEAELNQFPFF